MKQLVKFLLEGNIGEAQTQAAIFPNYYGSKLLNKYGSLTKFGLWDAVDYTFPRKLGLLLIKCKNGEEPTSQIVKEFNVFNMVFRLVDQNTGKLTGFAVVKAIQAMKVEQQCSALGGSFEILELKKNKKKVEVLVAEHFLNQGYKSINLEAGDFFVLMRCASWDLLSKCSTCTATPYLEAILVSGKDPTKRDQKVVSALLNGIKNSNQKTVVKNFKKIYPNTSLEETFPGLTSSYMAELYVAVGPTLLYRIAELFIEDPYQYRKGWPDVTIFKIKKKLFNKNETELFLREVKVRDKLLPSQIIALNKLKAIIPNIGVIKVKFS